MTFLIAYPATTPNRNPPPAEKRNSRTGKSEDALSAHIRGLPEPPGPIMDTLEEGFKYSFIVLFMYSSLSTNGHVR
jgi:hypothetical protein